MIVEQLIKLLQIMPKNDTIYYEGVDYAMIDYFIPIFFEYWLNETN